MGGNFTGGFKWAQKLLKLDLVIPPIDFEMQPSAASIEQRKEALGAWVKKYKPDSVLTAVSDVPDLLRQLGHRVPNDIAIAATSVHDIPIDAGIDQHPKAIGRIAVEMLVKQISLNERGEPLDPCRILVESRWQDGKSLPSII
jgi:DNA-binding LacI/PurR family transcriptional regulator